MYNPAFQSLFFTGYFLNTKIESFVLQALMEFQSLFFTGYFLNPSFFIFPLFFNSFFTIFSRNLNKKGAFILVFF